LVLKGRLFRQSLKKLFEILECLPLRSAPSFYPRSTLIPDYVKIKHTYAASLRSELDFNLAVAAFFGFGHWLIIVVPIELLVRVAIILLSLAALEERFLQRRVRRKKLSRHIREFIADIVGGVLGDSRGVLNELRELVTRGQVIKSALIPKLAELCGHLVFAEHVLK
jgi:hypothetical protein